MEEIIKYIVNKLVANPEAVVVEAKEEEFNVTLTVKVAKEDMGKVIGRNGKIADSIRAIVKSAGSGTGKKYFVKFAEVE